VEQADGAIAGLQAARQLRPSLIVGEHPMRLADGQALCEAIRSDPATTGIPFVAVTSRAMHEEVADAASTHDRVFTKPLDYPAVMQAVKDLLARSH
jgi:CheY-like chemotaxis protein